LLCLSECTRYRRLGELAGLTPAAWLRELRLDQAWRLLEAGGGSVTQVAETVGFASPRYFATLYTERFGRCPTDYPARIGSSQEASKGASARTRPSAHLMRKLKGYLPVKGQQNCRRSAKITAFRESQQQR
jgi:AraC-like DNA-binding protein